jgi:hypothetical protein
LTPASFEAEAYLRLGLDPVINRRCVLLGDFGSAPEALAYVDDHARRLARLPSIQAMRHRAARQQGMFNREYPFHAAEPHAASRSKYFLHAQSRCGGDAGAVGISEGNAKRRSIPADTWLGSKTCTRAWTAQT